MKVLGVLSCLWLLLAQMGWAQDDGCLTSSIGCGSQGFSSKDAAELAKRLDTIETKLRTLETGLSAASNQGRTEFLEERIGNVEKIVDGLASTSDNGKKVSVEAGTGPSKCPSGQIVVGLSWSVVSQTITLLCGELVR